MPVAWKPSADYEGVIGVWNTATHATIANVDTQAVVYWTTGAHAGVAVNKSLTNAKYDGELILDTEYTQAALEAALKAGKFMFHNVNGVTRVLEDINTLLTLSDTKGEVFQSNQTIRVCDQIANDTAVLFNTRYVGTVPNDASGRASLWGDVVKLIQELEKIRAVENFDPDTVTCEQGDKKKAVLLTINGLNIINAMAQLYMSVLCCGKRSRRHVCCGQDLCRHCGPARPQCGSAGLPYHLDSGGGHRPCGGHHRPVQLDC